MIFSTNLKLKAPSISYDLVYNVLFSTTSLRLVKLTNLKTLVYRKFSNRSRV